MMKRVLIADDNPHMCDLLATTLGSPDTIVDVAHGGNALRRRLRTAALHTTPDLVITDVHMPDWTGLQALSWLHLHMPTVPVVLVTAFGDELIRRQAQRHGAYAVLDKPVDVEDLRRYVRGLLHAQRRA